MNRFAPGALQLMESLRPLYPIQQALFPPLSRSWSTSPLLPFEEELWLLFGQRLVQLIRIKEKRNNDSCPVSPSSGSLALSRCTQLIHLVHFYPQAWLSCHFICHLTRVNASRWSSPISSLWPCSCCWLLTLFHPPLMQCQSSPPFILAVFLRCVSI